MAGLPIYTHHALSIPRYLHVPFDAATAVDYNAHPPASVLLALPLARLNYPDAVLVWNTISLAAFLASLMLVAVVLPVPRALFLPVVALLTYCHPLYGNLYGCQLTLILVLLITMIWALERQGHSGTAGFILGAAAAIKLFPAYLVIYYAARGRTRPLMTTALSFVALNFAAGAILGFDTYYDYVCVVLPAQTRFQSWGYNHAITGFWHKLFDSVGEGEFMTPLWSSPDLARWGILLSDLLITAVVVTLTSRARTQAQCDLAFALAVIGMLLVSPVTWDTSLPLLLVPIAIIARSVKTSSWIMAILLLILFVDWTPQIIWTRLALAGHSLRVAPWTFMLGAPSLKFYALLGTFALGLSAIWIEAKHPGLAPALGDPAT